MPDYTHNMVEAYMTGNCKTATEAQIECLDLINCLFAEVNPIPIKAALKIIGFDFGNPRLPLVKISKENKLKLEKKIRQFLI